MYNAANTTEETSVSDLPLADEEETDTPAKSSSVDLTDVLSKYETGDYDEDGEDGDDEEEYSHEAPISRLSSMMGKISAASMNEACGVLLRPDDEDGASDGDSNFMGGGSIDEL